MKNKNITSVSSSVFGVRLLALLMIFSVVTSCKDSDETPAPAPLNGTVYFVFENVVDGQPVSPGQMVHTNEAGNVYSVDLLKYYVSNFVFRKSDGTYFYAPNYELIDEELDTSKTFAVQLPVGNYTAFNYLLGVDSLRNVTGAQAGELSPNYGMFWDWNTGYIYFKHEGNFIDTSGVTQPITYHYGTVEALTTHSFSTMIPVSEQPRVVKIRFNLNKLYRSPNVIDFTNNNIHSGGTNWITVMRENFNGIFEVTAVE